MRRPRIASRANLAWLVLFPVFLLAAGLVVVRLWEVGTRTALHSTEGQTIEFVNDPAQPGFEAIVDPTPTLIVAHTDNGELIGVTVAARTSVEGGGHLVLVGPLLFVRSEPGSDEGRFLSEVYDSEGIKGVERLMGKVFGFGFTSAIELATEELAAAMDPAGPMSLELADDLVRRAESGEEAVWIVSGVAELDGPTAAAVYNFVNPAAVEVNRQERQRGLWQSWLQRIGNADDPAALAEAADPVLASYLLSLADGELLVDIMPTRLVEFGDADPFYVLEDEDLAWMAGRAEAMVPIPLPPLGESWPSIRLLDGVGNADDRNAILTTLFDLDLQVKVVGNASEFGVQSSSVIHHVIEDEASAAAVAELLEVDSAFSDDPARQGLLTVVIGEDWPVT